MTPRKDATLTRIAHEHATRRDDLMRAARTLKHCTHASPGTVAVYLDCVRLARHHNAIARTYKRHPGRI